jgi:hypothetical protein
MADVNATFDQDIQVNVYLSNQTDSVDAFQRPRFLVAKATNSLNGATVAVYLTLAEAKVAYNLGYISAGTLEGITTVFAQINNPAQGVSVANVDIVGSQSYGAALLASIGTDPVFYLVIADSRTSADIAGIAAVVETCGDAAAAADAGYPFKHMVYAPQSADTTLLTGALPSGLASLEGYERTILCYHPTATAWFDAAHQNRLSVDLATAVPPWNKWTVARVPAYPLGTINATQSEAAQTIFVDLLEAFGASPSVASPGQSQAGRQMTQVVTADWLAATIQQTIADTQVSMADQNLAITVDAAGQQVVVGCIQSVFATGVAARSLRSVDDLGNPGTSVTPLPITPADKVALRLRFDSSALLPQSANKIVVNVYTTT